MVDITKLTLNNILDGDRFLEVIDQCQQAVNFRLPNGKVQDLRRNVLLHNYLTWQTQLGEINRIELECHYQEDVERLIQFIK